MNWIEYGALLAISVSMKSKDPSTKVGAVIFNEDMKVISTGFNRFPSGFVNSAENWTPPKKYENVIHAECDCILNACEFLTEGCTLFSTLRPCQDCAKMICATKIKEVRYIIHREGETFKNTDEIFRMSGVECTPITEDLTSSLKNMLENYGEVFIEGPPPPSYSDD